MYFKTNTGIVLHEVLKATDNEDWVLIPYDVLFMFTQDFVYTFSVVIDVASKTTVRGRGNLGSASFIP